MRHNRPAFALLAVVLALTVALTLPATLPLLGSQLDPPRQYYYQPDNREYLKILDSHERDVTEIVRQRIQKLWGADATPYLSALTDKPYRGYYQSDSTLSQRRSIWRSSLFAKDLDFIEVSLSTFDGRFSLRETYAINRNDKRWVVIDSAGFPLFERVVEISSDKLNTPQNQRDFLLTLLSYAGYGSYDILSAPDTVYHGIDLGEKLGEDYYPFKSVIRGDTTETSFTCCLRDGVEVSRWRIKYFDDGLLIDESEQLVTYEDLPEKEGSKTDHLTANRDSSILAGMLSDVSHDSLAGDSAMNDSTLDSSLSVMPTARADTLDSVQNNTQRNIPSPRPQAPGGDIRLADLLRGQAPPPPANGHVSYEIITARLMQPTDSTPIDQMPEFTKFVEPVYPIEALAQKAEGEVMIMLRVDTTGKARQTMIRKHSAKKVGFELSAKRAGERSTFRPGIAGGKPADMWLTYKLSFRLSSGARYKDNETAKPDSAQADSTKSDTTEVDSMKVGAAPDDSTAIDTLSSTDTTQDTAVVDTVAPDTTTVDTAALDTTKVDTQKSDTMKVDSSTTSNDSTANRAPSDTTSAAKSDTASDTTTAAKSDTTKVKKDTSAAKDTTESK